MAECEAIQPANPPRRPHGIQQYSKRDVGRRSSQSRHPGFSHRHLGNTPAVFDRHYAVAPKPRRNARPDNNLGRRGSRRVLPGPRTTGAPSGSNRYCEVTFLSAPRPSSRAEIFRQFCYRSGPQVPIRQGTVRAETGKTWKEWCEAEKVRQAHFPSYSQARHYMLIARYPAACKKGMSIKAVTRRLVTTSGDSAIAGRRIQGRSIERPRRPPGRAAICSGGRRRGSWTGRRIERPDHHRCTATWSLSPLARRPANP